MTEEICKKENIEIICSQYDELTGALRQVRSYMGEYSSDYEFAKELLDSPVTQRLDWLSDKSYAISGNEQNATLEDYKRLADLLDLLH